MNLEKPKIGEPCNGCGLCCKLSICYTGSFLLGFHSEFGQERIYKECPALLQKNDGRFTCGLLENPLKFLKKSKYRTEVLKKYIAISIGAGAGCDEILEDDTPEEAKKLDKMIAEKMQDEDYKNLRLKALEMLYKFKYPNQ